MNSLVRDNLIGLSSCTCWLHGVPYLQDLTLSVDFRLSLRMLSCTCWSHGDPYMWGLTPSVDLGISLFCLVAHVDRTVILTCGVLLPQK